jgi:hypothetical protein
MDPPPAYEESDSVPHSGGRVIDSDLVRFITDALGGSEYQHTAELIVIQLNKCDWKFVNLDSFIKDQDADQEMFLVELESILAQCPDTMVSDLAGHLAKQIVDYCLGRKKMAANPPSSLGARAPSHIGPLSSASAAPTSSRQQQRAVYDPDLGMNIPVDQQNRG